MRRLLVVVALLGSACNAGPTRAACERLLDHVVELELPAGGSVAAAELATQRRQVTDEVRADFVASCVADVEEERVACGLRAASTAALSACDDTP